MNVYVDNGFSIEIDPSFKPTFDSYRPWYVNNEGKDKRPCVKRSEIIAGRKVGRRLSHLVLGIPPGSGVKTEFINGDMHDYTKANLRVKG